MSNFSLVERAPGAGASALMSSGAAVAVPYERYKESSISSSPRLGFGSVATPEGVEGVRNRDRGAIVRRHCGTVAHCPDLCKPKLGEYRKSRGHYSTPT
ncbi:hypothetical protein G7Y89_g9853 [Cudoniella acicularis]|uniref:Uncharacterized protein n=1 Tax=Cudoniella acicularis TaxID=354080 RepID=A0A8H4VZ96_9HELO|nr:hypothetical protein G7Y89_g9853 [Cudoniella acicularis]